MTYKYRYSNEGTILATPLDALQRNVTKHLWLYYTIESENKQEYSKWNTPWWRALYRDICGVGEVEIRDVTLFWAAASDTASVETSSQSY
jgi:hypothetical protein